MQAFNDMNFEEWFLYSIVTIECHSGTRVPVVVYCTYYCIIVVFDLMKLKSDSMKLPVILR
jgi:hypothetical protein